MQRPDKNIEIDHTHFGIIPTTWIFSKLHDFKSTFSVTKNIRHQGKLQGIKIDLRLAQRGIKA